MKTYFIAAVLALAGLSGLARAQTTLIDWTHTWKYFHPMGTFPAGAGNFATTWYLPDAQYDSPLPFGAEPRITGVAATADSYDSGTGASALGYDLLDYVINNAATAGFGQPAGNSLLTIPTSGARRTGYFKTSFTVATGMSSPRLEFLMDDGGYIYVDGVLVATVNITAGVADAYTSLATNATNTETDVYFLDLGIGGTRNLTGKVLATRVMPVNVMTPVSYLAPGEHTLAISLHQNSLTSSDFGLAAKLTATPGGCAFSASPGPVTRDYRGTPGNPNDDLISAAITITAASNNAPTWNVTANAPGEAANVTSGDYGTTHTFAFPVATITGGMVTLTFQDANDLTCTVPVQLPVPAPPYLMGKKRLNGVESDVYSAGPKPAGWTNATPTIFINNNGGNDRNVNELRTETLDLTGMARPVTVLATFRANESSATSNFEGTDNFSADIIEDDGAPVSMLPAGADAGDGTLSHATAAGPEVPNGPPNGWLNGYSGIDTADPNPVRTADEDYDFYVVRDEFNTAGVTYTGNSDQTYAISYTVPDAVNRIALSFRGGNDSATEVFTLSGLQVRNGTCDMLAVASNITRGIGVDAGDPADDEISCTLSVTGSGAQWSYGAFSGNYGTPAQVTVPVSQSGLPQTVTDTFDPLCSSTFTVTAPQASLVVTDTIAVGTDFTLAANPALSQSYVRPNGGTELGWTGGDVDVYANVQPAPNTTARYLDMNGKTAAPDFFTEAVIIAPSVEYVQASLDIGAYTTTATEFELDDTFTAAVELSADPAFPVATTTTHFIVGTVFPPPATGGVEFFAEYRVADPGINYGTVAYPAADFALQRRSVTVARGVAAYARMRISGGPSAAGSEHLLVDNIRFTKGRCTLTASPVVTRSNGGDDDTSNDVFSAEVTINAVANGTSTGWNNATAPNAGNYGLAATFGPYPVSAGVQTITVTDALDAACSLTFTLTPPACVLTVDTAGIVATRSGTGTVSVTDDAVSFDLTVTAVHGGTGWTSNLPVAGAPGTFHSGDYGIPVPVVVNFTDYPSPIVITDKADALCTLSATLAPPHHTVYALGTLIPLAGAASVFGSSSVDAANGWKNPADSVLTLDNPAPATPVGPYTVSADPLDASALGELAFTADLLVSETSDTSNFEAADTFKLTVSYQNALGQFSLNVIKPYDLNNNDVLNGYDDIAATPYDTNRQLDEYNRPLPGLVLAGQISHTFALSAVIPADADLVLLDVEGINNSATEHFRLANVRFTEQVPDPNADSDGDGVGSADELVMGTDPNDATSVTRLAQSAANPAQFSLTGVAGRFYRLYRSDDADEASHLASWADAGSPTMSGAGTHTITVEVQPGETRRYYRVHVMESDGPWPPLVP